MILLCFLTPLLINRLTNLNNSSNKTKYNRTNLRRSTKNLRWTIRIRLLLVKPKMFLLPLEISWSTNWRKNCLKMKNWKNLERLKPFKIWRICFLYLLRLRDFVFTFCRAVPCFLISPLLPESNKKDLLSSILTLL